MTRYSVVAFFTVAIAAMCTSILNLIGQLVGTSQNGIIGDDKGLTRHDHFEPTLIVDGGRGSVLGVGKVSTTDHANVLGSNHMNDYRLGARILWRLHQIAQSARAAWGSVIGTRTMCHAIGSST